MLIKCPECELQVSDKAVGCPHCGYPLQSNIAKRKPRAKNNKRRRLPNGFGQISEIKNRNLRNPFRAMVSIGKTDVGRPICKPLKPESYFPTYNEAYTALVAYNKNPYDLDSSIMVKELYEKWSDKHFKTLKSSRSINAVKFTWGYCSAVYDMRVIDLRARHIKGCMEEGLVVVGGNERRPNGFMKNKIKSMFNSMLDYAVEYELVDRNYARTFNLSEETLNEIKIVGKEHISFTDEEISLLWKNVKRQQYVDAILIQCYSGWRPQELGLIELKNVDLTNWSFTGGMKTNSGTNRIVPIHSKIKSLVAQKYKEAEAIGSKYLFNCTEQDRKGQNTTLTYSRYTRGFAKVVKELNLKSEHRPHDGRTHFVTAAKKYGVDEYAIKYVVGHAISDITEKVYTKREFDWLKEELEKIK